MIIKHNILLLAMRTPAATIKPSSDATIGVPANSLNWRGAGVASLLEYSEGFVFSHYSVSY
jgi:hypothetical protein